MQTSPTFLEIEQLTIRIFSFLPKWRKARFGHIDWSGISFSSEPQNLAYSHWREASTQSIQQLEERCCKMLNQAPQLRYIYPANYILTPLGPLPSELRDKIVLAMDPAKDDLRNRESWLRTVKRMDGR